MRREYPLRISATAPELSWSRTYRTVRTSNCSKKDTSGSPPRKSAKSLAVSSASVVFRDVLPCFLAPHSSKPQDTRPAATIADPLVDFVSATSPAWSESAYTSTATCSASLGLP